MNCSSRFIGAHVSIQGGVQQALVNAQAIGANAVAFFTKNQKRWFAPTYTAVEITQFKRLAEEGQFASKHLLAHASYLINLGSPDEAKRTLSIRALIDESKRCEQLGADKLVIHPGSHLRQISERESMDRIATSLNQVLAATTSVHLLLENTAGQGSNLGYNFEQLAYVLERVTNKNRAGVCLDTCHLFAAGYDFRTEKQFAAMLGLFNQTVGFEYLKGMHLNDSKCELGSHLDRHASLGQGKIGLDPFGFILRHAVTEDIPLILETPDPILWPQEIAMLRQLVK